MKVPNRVYARRHLRVDSRHFYAWKNNKAVPDGAILHWDADYSAGRELTRYGHKLESLVLGNQYQLQADGSTVNIGATMPVDTINGEKWLRSCGAVTNLLPSGAENLTQQWTPLRLVVSPQSFLETAEVGTHSLHYAKTGLYASTSYTLSVDVKPNGRNFTVLNLVDPGVADYRTWFDLSNTGSVMSKPLSVTAWIFALPDGWFRLGISRATGASQTGINVQIGSAPSDGVFSFAGDVLKGLFVRNPILTATSYPVPYVPPGVTQPATNATATNGAWFKLLANSELWKALTGQPLTLATRVRMGVGSGDLVDGAYPIASEKADNLNTVQRFTRAIDPYPVVSRDGTTNVTVSPAPWPRNAIIRRVTQVNTSGTQFRVGYAIEGTHTSIQWSAWVNYDSSFNPSTLYRLLLGFNNQYPMWFSKITAWRKQVSDDEIMEALS